MASREIESVVLLPIKPRYVAAILNGDKRVEFRRQVFKRDVTYVVIYACNPIQKIMGYFYIGDITEADPLTLWNLFKSDGAIDSKAYIKYFAGVNRGVAIRIGNVTVLDKPIRLDQLSLKLTIPQNFIYLNSKLFYRLCAMPYRTIKQPAH